MTENEISKVVVEAAIEEHRTLGGPGLLESVYEEALAYELELRGLTVSFFRHHRKVEHRNGTSSFKVAPLRKTISSLRDLQELMGSSQQTLPRLHLKYRGPHSTH